MTALLLLALAGRSCGVDRTAVKVGSDPEAAQIATTATRYTVEDLVKLPAPHWTVTLPRQPLEHVLAEVEAAIVGAKLEDDGDYHVVIAGDSGQTMIVEFPDPACAAASKFRAEIVQARAKLEVVLGWVPKSWRLSKTRPRVRITGPLHFDKSHGQTGVAPNAIEVHFVKRIEVVP